MQDLQRLLVLALDEGDDLPVDLRLRLGASGDRVLLSRITRRSVRQLGLTVGQTVFAQIKSVALQRGA